MGLDDGPADRQPDSGPGSLRGEERLEDTALVLLPYSGTGIRNRDHDPVRVLTDICLHLQHAGTFGGSVHGFDRVHDQVLKDLLQRLRPR